MGILTLIGIGFMTIATGTCVAVHQNDAYDKSKAKAGGFVFELFDRLFGHEVTVKKGLKTLTFNTKDARKGNSKLYKKCYKEARRLYK